MGRTLLFLTVVVAAPALKDRPAPAPFVGEWEAVRFTTVGPDSTASGEFAGSRPRHTFTANGRWLDGADEVGRFVLDPKSPQTAVKVTRLDVTLSGTFRVDGDVLTLTLSGWSGGRVTTATYHRVKMD
jgi:hypothetical protein